MQPGAFLNRKGMKTMKYLIIALTLLVTAAHAEIIAIVPTYEGGVRLTNDPCPVGENKRLAYLVEEGGKVTAACWIYDVEENGALVNFGNGNLFLYQLDNSMFIGQPKEEKRL